MSVTIVCRSVSKINTLHCVAINKIHPSYMVCGNPYLTFLHIPPPGLASSFMLDQNFSKGASFSNNFSRNWPLKK